MVEKLTFNEYMLQDSVFPFSIYENPKNEKVKYDPQSAVQLLAEAGWKERNAQGRLTKNGDAADARAPLLQPDVRAVLYHLPGGPPQSRHHAEPALRDA